MTQIEKVHYTSRVHIVGGRDEGLAQSDDNRLNIKFSIPGASSQGTNPEQLLAAGWSACFLGALSLEARKRNIPLPAERTIDAEIDLGTTQGEFLLSARLKISLPGIERETALALVAVAHETCPYSKALKGSIPVTVTLA